MAVRRAAGRFAAHAWALSRAANTRALFRGADELDVLVCEDHAMTAQRLPAIVAALDAFIAGCDALQLSIDLDVLPAWEAPGVSAPAVHGVPLALRMLMNKLDPAVAERPEDLVVYGGIGRAARDWPCCDRIVEVLRRLGGDETLLVQSGKPVGVFRMHADAPRVLIANSNLVPAWANWEHFDALDRKGLMMYGQMTAGS